MKRKFRSGVPDGDYVGLLENKKVFILSTRGDTGYGKNEKNGHVNFQTNYLKHIFGIMGVIDITISSLDNEEFDKVLGTQKTKSLRLSILFIKMVEYLFDFYTFQSGHWITNMP